MKSIRRMMMIGTVAFAITISSGVWSNHANANLSLSLKELETQKVLSKKQGEDKRELYQVLNMNSEEELYDALCDRLSLAEIAESRQVDVQKIIDLQASELMELTDIRLANGHLTLHEYATLATEIPDIIRTSVYGEQNVRGT